MISHHMTQMHSSKAVLLVILEQIDISMYYYRKSSHSTVKTGCKVGAIVLQSGHSSNFLYGCFNHRDVGLVPPNLT